MRSMYQVLSKQERLNVASEGGNVEIWVSQFIRQCIPSCRRSITAYNCYYSAMAGGVTCDHCILWFVRFIVLSVSKLTHEHICRLRPNIVRVTTLQCEIPWRFATLRSTRHVKCYSYHACTSVTVSGGGRNATMYDPKPHIKYLTQNRLLLNTCMDANTQLTINSFRPLFCDKIFSLKFPRHFPDF